MWDFISDDEIVNPEDTPQNDAYEESGRSSLAMLYLLCELLSTKSISSRFMV